MFFVDSCVLAYPGQDAILPQKEVPMFFKSPGFKSPGFSSPSFTPRVESTRSVVQSQGPELELAIAMKTKCRAGGEHVWDEDASPVHCIKCKKIRTLTSW